MNVLRPLSLEAGHVEIGDGPHEGDMLQADLLGHQHGLVHCVQSVQCLKPSICWIKAKIPGPPGAVTAVTPL
jgi:hypothetical protein